MRRQREEDIRFLPRMQSGARGFVSPSITWQPDDATSLTLFGNYSHIDETHGGGSFLPYQGTVVDRVVGGANYGRAGLAYEFGNSLTPYTGVATFFNPQVGTLASGALFDLTRENVAVAHPTIPFAQVQTGEVRSRGIELEGKVNVTDDLRVTAALTALDIEITRDTDATVVGKTPFIVPEVVASASADYTLRGDGWYDGVTVGAACAISAPPGPTTRTR